MTNEPNTFALLRNIILSRMRMSHIYQPVMLRTLLADSGKGTIRQIAAEFLARDERSDETTNLQALCYLCNANKGARDSTDFRRVREDLGHREQGCEFSEVRVIASNELAYAIRDAFPVTPLHTLLIPRRHT